MKHTLIIFLLLGVVRVCLSPADGGTPWLSSRAMADTCMVGGPITTNTTWSTANCDTYVVYGNMSVEPGVTLTIESGVVVAFQEGYRLDVGGALTARGTATDSIVFTGWESDQSPQWWEWIKFRNSSIDTACSLSYCRIEYAEEGVYCDTSSPTIRHCLIRKCRDGIYCYAGSPYIAQNTIMDNHTSSNSSGIYIWGGSPVIFGNVIQQNHFYGIYAMPWGSAEPCTSLSITADTIRNNEDYGIRLYGMLAVISGTIRSCDINGNPSGGVKVDLSGHGGNVRITNSHIHNNTATDGGGIYFAGGFAVIDSNCIFGNSATNSGNTAGGIYFDSVDSARVQYNDIVGNSGPTKYAYEVYSGEPSSPDIHGEHNWWGTTDSVEIANLIYDYYDNIDLRKFIFAPFATLPYCPPESSWVEVTVPNGGECWRIGTTYDITWDHSSFSDSVIIECSIDNEATWDTIVDTTTNDGVHPWTIPDTPSDSCLIRISHIGDNIPSDKSDSLFSIVTWIRGDANGDGVINSADVVYLINYLFTNGPAPIPLQAGDVNCDGEVNSADVIYLINYLFVGGPPPCEP